MPNRANSAYHVGVQPGSHPYRLMISAHELGHAVVWRDEGLPRATVIEVRGSGQRTVGAVRLRDRGEARTEAFARRYLVGLLAGVAAGNRWRELHAPRLAPDESAVDQRYLRLWLALPVARRLDVAELRDAARAAVWQRWPEIARLTPILAVRGSVTL